MMVPLAVAPEETIWLPRCWGPAVQAQPGVSKPGRSTHALSDAGFYVPEIDGLRAVAVGAVMLYHLNSSLMPGGFVGV